MDYTPGCVTLLGSDDPDNPYTLIDLSLIHILSVMESLYHAGFENDSQVEIKWVESEDLPDQAACREAFADVDGIIVPGGFGDRGIAGSHIGNGL